MIEKLIIVFVGSSTFFMFLQVLMKVEMTESILASLIGGAFVAGITYPFLDSIDRNITMTENQSLITDMGFRYFKEIESQYEKDRVIENTRILRDICDGDEYRVTDNHYDQVNVNSHTFREETTYLFCKDNNKHSNKIDFININEYIFIEKFPEYPSSHLISKFCSLEEAVVVNKDMAPITYSDVALNRVSKAYLYCPKNN